MSIIILHKLKMLATEEIVDETGNTVRPEYGPTAFFINYISQYLIRELSNIGTYKASSKANSNLKDLMAGDMEKSKKCL